MGPEPQCCEVLVVGAGPAGADLASQLARRGVSVLLVDQLCRLDQSAFSSAAMPLESVEHFGLPAEVVGARWDTWTLIGPADQRRDWTARGPLGVVLDFGALRQWLANQMLGWGGSLALGRRALHCEQDGRHVCTTLRCRDGALETIHSHWLVDATGQARSLIGDPRPGRHRDDRLIEAIGVEWLLRLPLALTQPWQNRLSFMLGSDWAPAGYGWLFPMQPGMLKLGVCRLKETAGSDVPLSDMMERLLERVLPQVESGDLQVLDRHGGMVRSSISRREPHRRGRLIGIGDAVSTANLLGGEGIRHALTSSRVLAPRLAAVVKAERCSTARPRELILLDAYPVALRRALGWRWSLSGRIARRTWRLLRGPEGDRRLSQVLTGLEASRAEDLSALLFDYRFERYGMRLLPYLLGWR
ncbi:MAG: NAD(P)/FAD-dependent oxidoreductase [Synechococcaceae cyanobacterium]|nr:NAD(P)/FAD-dependent oxidoreductase [Synechococcaceae cyanobacterium]